MNQNPKIMAPQCNRFIMFALFVFAIGFSGCSVQRTDPEYNLFASNLDLQKYIEDDIFITTGDFSGKYQPVSLLRINCSSGIIAGTAERDSNEDDIYRKPQRDRDRMCNLPEMLNELVLETKTFGANGIINLKIDTEIYIENGLQRPYLVLSGLVIKIEK